MQQFMVPLCLVVGLMASGCSQISSLGLGKSDTTPRWESARLDFVVDREEAKRTLRASNRAERERRMQEVFAQETDGTEPNNADDKVIQMISKPNRGNQQFREEANHNRVQHARQTNPLNPRAVSEPSASVVAHPLHPRSQQLSPQANSDQVVIQQLPPMVPAPLERNAQQSMLVPKTDAATAPVQHRRTNAGEIQLVGWDEEIQQQDETKEEPQTDASVATSEPKRDAFTDGDFFAAGWCRNDTCQDGCEECKSVQASDSDPKVPNIVPAQFQVKDGPKWELPGLDMKLKPLRTAQGTPRLPAPGLRSDQPTQLPVPGKQQEGSQDQPIRTASATLGNRTANSVSNADFHAADTPPMTWRQHLNQAMETIQAQIKSSTDFSEQRQLQGKLELLRLMPSHLDDQQQQYMDALTELLQSTTGTEPVDIYEAGQTLNQLRDAIAYLETIAGMKVVNAHFCTKVKGFGQFEAVETKVFEPGQTILIYCEIENHTSQQKVIDDKQMSSTRLGGSCIVYDMNQNVVQQEEFPVVEDLATQRRRDFYMHIPFVVGDLPPGKYKYQLMIDDIGGGKSASLEPALIFEVR